MGETVKHRAVYKTVKIRLDTHIFLFYLPKTKKKRVHPVVLTYDRTPHMHAYRPFPLLIGAEFLVLFSSLALNI